MFQVDRLENSPSTAAPTVFPRFVATLPDGLPLKSVSGMSGGPISGFRREPQFARTWIVALQSSWVPERRIVYACPLPLLASLMIEWADQTAA